ncbi:MAG TPA: SurA N-terminal domain-containing protein [Gaiellaceae bacterium]|nr:SurA N-terminal domain-containing protein [Gaiellaceae bacterium]
MALAGCGGSSSAVPRGTVAVACGQTVTQAQFDALMRQGRAVYASAHKSFPAPGTPTRTTIEQHVVALLVQHAEQRYAAASLGVRVSSAEVAKSVTQAISSQFGGSRAKFDAALRKQGMTEADFRDSMRSNLLQQALVARITRNVRVSSAAIAAYYDAHRSQYVSGKSRLVRAAGKTFLLKTGDMPTKDLDVAFSLPVGKASRKLHYGSSLISVTPLGPVRPPAPIPLSQVRVPIAQYLLGVKRNAAIKKWAAGLSARCGKTARYAAAYKP